MKKVSINTEKLEKFLLGKTLAGQHEAITAPEPLVVVSAGAGTGKTWTLAWRFAWAVVTGRSTPGQILTLTFTEKAAREMKERIAGIFDLLGSAFPESSSFLENAKEQLDEGYISTIHSFAMRVIRESSLHLSIDPEARPVTSPDEDAFWRQIEESLDILDSSMFRRYLSGKWRDHALEVLDSKSLEKAVNTYGADSITDFASRAVAMFSPAGKKPEDLLRMSREIEELDARLAKKLQEELEPSLEEIWEEWSGDSGIIARLNISADDKTKLAEKIRDFAARYGKTRPESSELPRFCTDLSEALKNGRGKLKEKMEDLLGSPIKELREKIKGWSLIFEFIENGCSPEEIETRSTLVKFAALCWKTWEEEKIRKALVSFDDMIDQAGKALEKNSSYAGRFNEILLDEFQDTNGLQDELTKRIWDQERVKLFIVGDLKQSIYGFRYAEPALFLKYIDKAKNKTEGRYINLNKSFRTSDILLDDINSIFQRTWEKGLGRDLLHPYEELRPPLELEWHEERQNTDIAGLTLAVEEPTDEGEENTGELREKLARKVGRELTSLKMSGKTIWDKDLCSARPVEWRDMAILVPARTQYDPLEKVFTEEMSLPVYFVSSTGYYSRSEILDMVALLGYLQDRGDSTSLLHFLSSPFSGLSLHKVRDISMEFRKNDLSAEKILEIAEDKKPGISSKLLRMAKKGVVEGPSRVIEELVADGKSLKRYPPWLRKRASANMRKAIDIVREYETCRGKDLEGCVEYLYNAAGRGIKLEEAPLTGEDENVIRVMTVHSAKGLEFPITVLFGCEQTPSAGGRGTSINPSIETGAALSRLPEEDSNTSSARAITSEIYSFLKRRSEDEQWQRLFYVACTRTRDRLYICGVLKSSGEKASPPSRSWLAMMEDFPDKMEIPEKLMCPEQESSSKKERTGRDLIPTPGKDGVFLERITATSFALFCFCPYAYRMKYMQGMDLEWELPGGDAGGSDLGTLAHWLLQHWDFRTETLDDLVPEDRSEANALKEDIPFNLHAAWETDPFRRELRKWFHVLASSDLGKTLAEKTLSGRLKREFAFNIRTERGIRLTGSIDVMWTDEKEVHLRDYKITAERNTPDNLYTSQMGFYSLVLSLWLPHLKQDVRLYHLREGKESEPLVTDSKSIAAVKEKVREAGESAAKKLYPPALNNCGICPFRKSCTLHY